MFFGESQFRVGAPKIDVVNAIGSGDSSVAGFAFGLHNNLPQEECVKYAVSCGSANALENTTGCVNVDTVKKFLSELKVQKI